MAQPTVLPARPVPRRSRRPQPIPAVRYQLLDPRRVNLLVVQMRSQYDPEGISRLGGTIADVGLLEPSGVAELDHDHALEYLKWFNEVYGVDMSLSDYPVDSSGYYLFAVYGHRRTLGGQSVYAEGCPSCRKAGKTARQCLASHPFIDPSGLPTNIYHNIAPEDADRLQTIENTYLPPTQEDQARDLERKWRRAKRRDPKLTVTKFSEKLNLSPGVVGDAIKFCQLPEGVQAAYQAGTIKYTSAVELSRLQAAGMAEDAVLYSMQRIIAEHMTTAQAAKFVSGVLAAKTAPAIEADALFIQEGDSGRKSVLDRAVIKTAYSAVTATTAAYHAAQDAVDAGVLPACNPLSDRATAQMAKRAIQLHRRLGTT